MQLFTAKIADSEPCKKPDILSNSPSTQIKAGDSRKVKQMLMGLKGVEDAMLHRQRISASIIGLPTGV